MSGFFYLAVVQAVLLFGAETWFIILRIGRILGRFHHRVTRRLAGMKYQIRIGGIWVYPLLGDALPVAGLEVTKTYISICQNAVTQYIVT